MTSEGKSGRIEHQDEHFGRTTCLEVYDLLESQRPLAVQSELIRVAVKTAAQMHSRYDYDPNVAAQSLKQALEERTNRRVREAMESIAAESTSRISDATESSEG